MLCCIGDLVEDVVVWPVTDLQKGTDTPARVFRRRGGSAANVCVVAVEAGVPSRFVGQVGDDGLGTILAAEMKTAGVDVVLVRRGTTGSVVVIVDQFGERSMLPDRGAATELASLPDGALDDVTWLHVPAYSLIVEPLGTTTCSAITTARQLGIPVSIDASSTGPLTDFGVDEFIEQMQSIAPEVFFCNSDEATLLRIGRGSPLPGAGLTVIKAGAEPVTLLDRSGTTAEVAVPTVDGVVDTTGAGDAFAAGFLAATLEGAVPVAATQAANRLAATVLQRPGAGRHDH